MSEIADKFNAISGMSPEEKGRALVNELAKAQPFVPRDGLKHVDVKYCLKLIAAGATLNEKVGGWNPVMHASVFYGGDVILKELLAHNAPVNDVDKSHSTALVRAVWLGRTETVRMLLAAGADPAIKDCDGNDAFFYAQDHSTGMMEMLKTAQKELHVKATRPNRKRKPG